MRPFVPLVVLLLLSGCISSEPSWKRVGADAFEEAIARDDGFLLDVRTLAEWEQDGHLANATLISHTELEARQNELPTDKDEAILLYCRSGNRSQDAALTLQELGFTNIIELETGINGWKDAGKPVVYE
jgi:rhodanese-related sulfurtransferase